ncbi:hypothetical protein DL95DRAFT_416922 [Leptodontidium sp. 2 PMI_412]|nr:hypothetical protein DL95DRAFT_416922 [Leptodontidium sp. 2 PMI_412]
MGALKMFYLHLCLFVALFGLANSSNPDHHAEQRALHYDSLNSHLRRAENNSAETTKSFKGLPQSAVERAREIIDAALVDWALQPRCYEVTEDIAAAAALVAEIDAAAGFRNGTVLPPLKKRAGEAFWMETISRSGTQPYGGDGSYKVFRNVKTDFGAKGDGMTDDTNNHWS